MSTDTRLRVGVDGGGSGTRLIASMGVQQVTASAGPSGLGLGVERAWQQIMMALAEAQKALQCTVDNRHCHLALGLAGANQRRWHDAFLMAARDFASVRLETDAFTTLMGAHAGAPGVIIALGTGSVGEALHADGRRACVGGYGFPSGDEASGAWLGLRASTHAQKALDGRVAPDNFSQALCAAMANSSGPVDDTSTLVHWLSEADQTRFASLAPVVLEYADHPVAQALLRAAGEEVTLMVQALDPRSELPVALCGGLGQALAHWVPTELATRLVAPKGASVEGALLLAHENISPF